MKKKELFMLVLTAKMAEFGAFKEFQAGLNKSEKGAPNHAGVLEEAAKISNQCYEKLDIRDMDLEAEAFVSYWWNCTEKPEFLKEADVEVTLPPDKIYDGPMEANIHPVAEIIAGMKPGTVKLQLRAIDDPRFDCALEQLERIRGFILDWDSFGKTGWLSVIEAALTNLKNFQAGNGDSVREA